MPDANIHALALQIAQASQKYEQYINEINALAQRYSGTLSWVESLLGEPTNDVLEMFGEVDQAVELHKKAVLRCRNSLLKISQALIKLSGEK